MSWSFCTFLIGHLNPLKETTHCLEKSGNSYPVTRCHIAEGIPQLNHWENLKSQSLAGNFISTVKVKVKWSHYRPGVAQRLSRGIALLFHDHGIRRGWVVSVTPRPHSTPGKDLVPILQEAGWAAAPVWTDGKSHPPRDSIPDRPAISQSLYRLSYPTHFLSTVLWTLSHICSSIKAREMFCRKWKYRSCTLLSCFLEFVGWWLGIWRGLIYRKEIHDG